jgi:hypothetical protein
MFYTTISFILRFFIKIIESIFYILDKTLIIVLELTYCHIINIKRKPCLYEIYGFNKKYKSPEMDKFLESYKPIIVKIKLNKLLFYVFNRTGMTPLNTFLLLNEYVKEIYIVLNSRY